MTADKWILLTQNLWVVTKEIYFFLKRREFPWDLRQIRPSLIGSPGVPPWALGMKTSARILPLSCFIHAASGKSWPRLLSGAPTLQWGKAAEGAWGPPTGGEPGWCACTLVSISCQWGREGDNGAAALFPLIKWQAGWPFGEMMFGIF